jgi:glycosyltransferase involved in cell wall biosynthesis
MRRFLQAGLVADRARRQAVRHIHAHFATAAAEVARDAARLSGVPFTVTAHAKDVFHTDNVAHLADRVAGAGAVVTVSDFNVAHLSQRLNVPIRRVPNGIRIAARGVGPDASGPVLCVARLVPKKGIDVLIEATALLASHDSELHVQIIGGGQLADDLQRLANRLGVGDRVAFAGPCPWPAVEDAYRRCSMVVLPCRVDADGDRDGLPTVLLEALARALPVVSTDLVGIPEVVTDGQTGLLVAPNDPVALAAAIARLRADTELASRLGRAGRALVAERFDPEQAIARLRSVFAEAGGPSDRRLDRPVLERS